MLKSAIPVSRSATFAIDLANLFFIGVSGLAAYFFPFELFLAAYAILGPLHYLTEIRWLAKRNYYQHAPYGVAVLFALGLFAVISEYQHYAFFAPIIFVALAFCFSAAFSPNPLAHVLTMLGAFLYSPLVTGPKTSLALGLYLPTLIHVYVFTALFMIAGSLRSKSFVGYVTFAFFLAVSAWLLFFSPVGTPRPLTPYVLNSIQIFGVLPGHFSSILPFQQNRPAILSAMRFIAFAYTYHYLNWFSKTKLIRWHVLARWEIILIAVVYAGSLALYAFDYVRGLYALYFLSLLHVILEFPLNFRTAFGFFRRPAS